MQDSVVTFLYFTEFLNKKYLLQLNLILPLVGIKHSKRRKIILRFYYLATNPNS